MHALPLHDALVPSLLAVPAPMSAPTSLPSPGSGVWYLGPVPLRAYSLCILAGIFVAVWWSGRRYQARGGSREQVLDVAVLAVPAGVVGARLYHVLSSPQAFFGPGGDLSLIPQTWKGGLGVWGGIAAGAAAAAWMIHHRGLRFAPFADAVAPTLLVAQAIGRFGNWFNQELFGAPTTLPWGLEIDDVHLPAGYAPGTLFHPTFLYECLWNLAGAGVLLWLERRLSARQGVTGGRIMWAYLMVYTSGRVWIEMLRIDPAETVGGLRLNVWTAVVVFAVGAAGFVWSSRRPLSDAVRTGGGEPSDGADVPEDGEEDTEDAAEDTEGAPVGAGRAGERARDSQQDSQGGGRGDGDDDPEDPEAGRGR